MDRGWVIARVNAAQERITGKPRSETIGREYWEVWPEVADPRGAQWREFHRCMEERVAVAFDSYVELFDAWFAIAGYPTSTGGIAVFFRDVTVQKKAELALRAEHAFIAAVLDTVANLVMVLDRDGRIVRVNEACERATGYGASELIGRFVFDALIPEDELPGVRETFRQLRAGHFPNRHQNRWRMKDGSERTFEWNNTAIVGDDGLVRFVIATGLDVTDRRRDEERLRTSEAALDAFFSQSPGILNLVDEDLRFVNTDPLTPTYFGLTRDSIAGKSLSDIAPEIIANYGSMVRRVIDTGEAQLNVEVHGPVSGRPGEIAHWRASFFPVPLPGGRRGIGVMGVEITDLEKAEEALRDAERQYRTLAENAPEVIARFDRQLRHTYVNEYGAKVYGVPARDVIGKTNAELGMPPDKVAFWKRHFEEAFDTGEQRTVDFDFDSPALGKQFFSSLLVPERDETGSIVSILAITRDVTGLRRAEERMRETQAALRVSEEAARAQTAQLEAILEAGADGLVVYDRAGRTLRSTRAADELLGIPVTERSAPVQERIGQQYEILDESGRRVPPEEMIAYRAAVKGETVRGEVLSVRPAGGAQLWLRMSAVPFYLDGRHAGAVLSITDISRRKRAEEALRASEEKFRSIFEQAAIGMGRVRFSDARWIDVNDAFCRMLGLSRDEMLRTPWPEITHPDDVDLDLVPFRRMAAGALDSYTIEKRFIHADGRHVWAKLTLSLVRDEEGRPDYEIAVIEDVTDRKLAAEELRRSEAALRDVNERLREADRRKDEFLGMLSHELRNPLAPIRNALYILDHANPAGQQARRAKDIAGRQVTHLTRLVDDLLDVTRISRGKIELRHEDLDVPALARRVAEDYRPLMQDRRLDLAVELPGEPVVVNGDPTRLTQILGNLLNNAAKFTPAGGRVTLGLALDDGRAVIRVRDTGAGIAPDLLETVFEPFTQAKQTLARSEGGLGLGLALVKGLVALHGGEVAAYSDGSGRGTEFVVRLPLAAQHAVETSEDRSGRARARARARRVLVIDDNKDAAESLAELVSMVGHTPDVAYDAFDGLTKAAELLPDVVLCDIGLPGMDGYEFARQMRALSGERPVRLVAVSGYAQPEDVARATEAGFDAHVAKPPDPERLAHLLA